MNTPQVKNSGFTITELMVIIVIIGTIGSIGLTITTRELQRERINAVTVGLAGWIEEVRRSALRGYPCRITISGNAAGFPRGQILASAVELDSVGTPIVSSKRCPATTTSGNAAVNDYAVPSSVAGNRVEVAQTRTLTFSPLGTANPVSDQEIVLTLLQPSGQRTTASRCIRIRGMMGFLDIGNRNSGTCSYASRY